jgi:hypothetical protein
MMCRVCSSCRCRLVVRFLRPQTFSETAVLARILVLSGLFGGHRAFVSALFAFSHLARICVGNFTFVVLILSSSPDALCVHVTYDVFVLRVRTSLFPFAHSKCVFLLVFSSLFCSTSIYCSACTC